MYVELIQCSGQGRFHVRAVGQARDGVEKRSSDIAFHWIARKRVFTWTLNRCATLKQAQGRVFQHSVEPPLILLHLRRG
jgi:hypothetical protein